MNTSGKSIIQLKGVHKYFGTQHVLRGVDLQIPQGEVTVIIGRSGSGKSVILKHIIGLIRPDQGRVLVDGQDLTTLDDREINTVRRRFGMLFQDGALFDSMNVLENVAFPLREHTKMRESQIREKVAKKLRLVGLEGVEHKMPSQLSGGMRKRVGLARAIALDPEIILFDEPTTGLDPLMTDAINRLIADTQAELGVTAVVISHDIEGAYEVADQIAMLYEGEIIAWGSPDQIKQMDNEILQQFINGRAQGPIEVI